MPGSVVGGWDGPGGEGAPGLSREDSVGVFADSARKEASSRVADEQADSPSQSDVRYDSLPTSPERPFGVGSAAEDAVGGDQGVQRG